MKGAILAPESIYFLDLAAALVARAAKLPFGTFPLFAMAVALCILCAASVVIGVDGLPVFFEVILNLL